MNIKNGKIQSKVLACSLLIVVAASAWMGTTYYFANRVTRELHVWLDVLDSLEHISISELHYKRRLFEAKYSFRIDLRGPIGDLYEKQMIAQGKPASPLPFLVVGSIYYGPFLFQDRSFRLEQAFTEFQLFRPERHHGILIDGKKEIRGEITSRLNGDYSAHLITPEYDGPLTIGDGEVRLSIRPSNLRLDYSDDLNKIELFLTIADISLLEEEAFSASLREIEGSFSLLHSSDQERTSNSVLRAKELTVTDLSEDDNSTKLEGILFRSDMGVGGDGLRAVNVHFNLSRLIGPKTQTEDIGISAGFGREFHTSLPWEGFINVEIGRALSDDFRATEMLAFVEADVSESGVSLTALTSAEAIYATEISSDLQGYRIQLGVGGFENQEFNNFQKSVFELMRDPVTRYSDPYDVGVSTREIFRRSFTLESQNPVKLAVTLDWNSEGRAVHFNGEFPINAFLESGDAVAIFYPNQGIAMDIEVTNEILDLVDAQNNDVRSYLMELDPQGTSTGYRFLIEERGGEMFVGDTQITEEYIEFMNGFFGRF